MRKEQRTGSKICILVTSAPESTNTHTLVRITDAALRLGHRVRIFLMYDGVYHVQHEVLHSLIEKGVEVSLCARNAQELGVEKRPGILFGSQYDLAVMVSESDAFLSLH